jgi:hypothetical protein
METAMRKRIPPAGGKPKREKCRPIQATLVGGRVLPYYDSVLRAIGIDPATEPADRPKTVTIKRTMELTGLSKPTVERMIAAGRAEGSQENAAKDAA